MSCLGLRFEVSQPPEECWSCIGYCMVSQLHSQRSGFTGQVLGPVMVVCQG